jgi:peptide/nickel transport system permease protein
MSILQAVLRAQAIQRLGRAILVAFGVMVVAFSLIHFIPGDPVMILLGDMATPDNVAEYRQILGLNGSLPEQFVSYFVAILHGDLGTSLVTRLSVDSVIARTLPVTLWLIAVAMGMGLVISLPLAVAAAIYRRTWFGQVFRIVTSIFLSMPAFFSGLLAILLFAIALGLAPVAGYEGEFPKNLTYLWLPALVICGVQVPILSRVLQSSIVETMEQEFVETAVVRGLPRHIMIWRYLIRPSIAPTISLLGYIIGQSLGAAVVVEIIFGLPGIGTELINAVAGRDYSLVQGIIFVFGLIVVIVSYISETASGWIDPRTKST